MTCRWGGALQGTAVDFGEGGVTVDAEAQTFRHSEAAGRGIPQGGAHAQIMDAEARALFLYPRKTRGRRSRTTPAAAEAKKETAKQAVSLKLQSN